MLMELVLEFRDGRKARIQFAESDESNDFLPCEGPECCQHRVTPVQAAQIFKAIDVSYSGNARESAQQLVAENKGQRLIDVLHMSPNLSVKASPLTIQPAWNQGSTKELLELYLLGFTPRMLAKNFQMGVSEIVRKLSLEVFGDNHLEEDRTKPRHQKPWHRDEILFLTSQMQVGRTPSEISALMDRDALGIAFRLFETLPVPIPRQVIDQYAITVRTEPLGPVPLDGRPF